MIIFDLDDTLIDTSGSVTPFKLQRAVEILVGKRDGDALKRLVAINRRAARTQDAIRAFGQEVGATQGLIEDALNQLKEPLPKNFSVSTTPNAKEILSFYSNQATLALVTVGHPPFQKEKAEKAGLELSIFSKIAIPENSFKRPFYEALAKEYSTNSKNIWVCGDRVSVDLQPAYELGFRTIHMRWGRGEQEPEYPWLDGTVRDLNELRKIIQ